MRFDWQAVAVALIVAAALLYAARRVLVRLRSFRIKGGAACATGCGKCGDVDEPVRQTTQLTRPGGPKRRGAGRN